MLLLQARVSLGIMAIKGYPTLSKTPALLEPHHQIVLCHIQDTHWGSLTPLQRCSWCIWQPQLTGPVPRGHMVKFQFLAKFPVNHFSHPVISTFIFPLHHFATSAYVINGFVSITTLSCCIFIFTNPSTWAGYDTRSIFKQSLTGLNSEISFS